MHRAIFNTMGHHAHMYVMYKGAKHYVIASNLNEGLFALIDSKTDTPPELWQLVRC